MSGSADALAARERKIDEGDGVNGIRIRLCFAFLMLLVVASAAAVAVPATATATTVADQLRTSRRELSRAQGSLEAAEDALDAARSGRQRRGVGVYVRALDEAAHAVRFWRAEIADLLDREAEQKLATLERSGDWRPLIERAAKRQGVSADGLYRLMMMESGGKARAVGAGCFFGLFQYTPSTWKADWNPWREQSIFDGSAQIEASAYAVKRGIGRSLWGNTFPAAF